ncbi:DUF559 domain-containing protein [Methylococcus sp. Mc7]|uniref:DUF559 domain-containing protein n=1 Tax=Methylococcus sp. Mc7 TaxID=2860258 RepID=UPI002107AA55|nr:DUF559 domain-containing protein [Methylococcus sp. Mc7]
MGGEWRDSTLGEVTDFLSGGTPSKSRADYWNGSIPWVSAKDMKQFRLEDSEDHVTEAGASNGTRLAPAGSVLLLVRGMTLLNDLPICVINKPMTFNQDVKALRLNTHVTDDFLPYLLLGNKDRLLSRVDLAGHGTGRLNSDELKALEIGLPPKPEQRAIAHILGTLDDKIELNRRRNQTLEAMARALFKDWFVDFGPVRARMQLPSPSGRGVGGEGAAPNPRIKLPLPPPLLDNARALRKHATDAETLLWRLLRNQQLAGAKFRRQHSLPPYILDFYCHALKLAVELDGGQHNSAEGQQRDARRSAYLEERGIRVLRFWNNDVLRETEAVLEAIYQAVQERQGVFPSPPAPLPGGEGSPMPFSLAENALDERACLPADLWQLFPDRLDDEGKPEGWSKRPLDEIADFLNGLALQKFPATDPDDRLPVTKIAELRNGVSAKSDRASREVPAKYIIKDGDFLFSWSGSLLAKFWTEGEGALNQHLFKVTSESYPMWFVSHWVHHHLEAFQAIAASKATTMGHIQRGHLEAAMTLCPPDDVLERLGVVMAPLVEQSIHNELESRTLAQLRNTLLPKLISGELRIADAEEFLERIA